MSGTLTNENGDGRAATPDGAHEQAVVEHGRQLRGWGVGEQRQLVQRQ